MGVFHFVWNFFFGSFEWLISFIKKWFIESANSGFSPNLGTLLGLTIIFIIIVASCMVAITVAETKNRNRPLHGVLGILLPGVYPLLLHFVLPEFNVKIKTKEDKEVGTLMKDMGIEGVVAPESELKSIKKAEKLGVDPTIIDEAVEEGVLNQEYFARIANDENGNPRGPFMLELDDDRVLSINKISVALDQVLAVEMGDDDDKKTIRLPYSKIKTCQLESEYMSDAAY